jgi:hypothetical protein
MMRKTRLSRKPKRLLTVKDLNDISTTISLAESVSLDNKKDMSAVSNAEKKINMMIKRLWNK